MLDIEGLEYEVLKGAASQLKLNQDNAPNIVFEVHKSYVNWDNGLENSEIIKFLMSFGYKIYAVRDYNSNENMEGMPVEIIPVNEVYLEGPPHGFNMLAVKDERIIDNEVFKICHNVSPKLLKHKDPTLYQPLP